MDLLAVGALVVGGVGTVFAGWQMRDGRAQRRLDGDRRHAELCPQLQVDLVHGPGAGADQPLLTIQLTGPAESDGLQVTVTVRDDHRHEPIGRAGEPSAEDLAAQVWGPFRLRPGVDGADPVGRGADPVQLRLNEPRRFQLERTPPPRWAIPGDWTAEYAGQPARLTFDCTLPGHAPWRVDREIVPTGTGAPIKPSTGTPEPVPQT